MTLKPAVDFHMLDLEFRLGACARRRPRRGNEDAVRFSRRGRGPGVRTRLIRFRPGAVAPDIFVHDYWEEVYLLSGRLVTGCDGDGNGGTGFDAPSYACRPPNTQHGPFTSVDGCVFFEIQYYPGANDGS